MTLADLMEAEDNCDEAEKRWLRQQGWRKHCEAPGSIWLWQKAVEGLGTVLCPQSTARQIEENLHAYSED